MKRKILATIVAAGTVLSGCSGGGSGGAVDSGVSGESSSATAVAGYLSGTAAVGAPLGLANVTIKGASGACNTSPLTGLTNSQGVFSIDVASCTAPYYIKVSSTIGEVSTLAMEAGAIANVTPLTQLIAQRAVNNEDLSSAGSLSAVTSGKLATVQAEIKNVLKKFAVAINAASSEAEFESKDLLSGAFVANGTGVDKLLDLIKVERVSSSAQNITIGTTPIPVSITTSGTVPSAPADADIAQAASEVSDKAEMLADIRTFANGLTAIFKNGAPSLTLLNNFLASNFMHSGQNAADLLEELQADGESKGIQFRNIVVLDESPTNFWVSFQIFGVENGKYALWGTWTSKVENPQTAPKLLGNTLGFRLDPAFVKVTSYSSSNVKSAAASVRALRIGVNVADSNSVKHFVVKELGGALGTQVKVLGGLLDPSYSNNNSRRFHDLSSEYIKLASGEATAPVVKIKYDITDVSGAVTSADQEAYLPVMQLDQEKPGHYMELAMPAFDATGGSCKWNYATLENSEASEYSLVNQNLDFGFVAFYVDNPAGGFLSFHTNDSDSILTNFQTLLGSYHAANSSETTMKSLAYVLGQYGPNDVLYSHITKCD